MFLSTPKNPSKFKKVIYLTATTFLGVMLSFMAHAFIEIIYLNSLESRGIVPFFYGNCALSPILSAGLLLLGLVGGFMLGRFWWRKVYIERVWAKK